jgi:tetratricopeptide (TPR) repeat protein
MQLSTLLDQALAAHRAGELPRAESLYRQTLRIDPQHVDAWHLLGVARLQQRDHAGARENIQRAMGLGGRSAAMHANLGSALRELGRLDEAERHLRRAVELAPETAGFHYNLGNCLRDLRRLTEAIDAYRAALERAPHSAETYNNLGDALRSAGRDDEAEAAFQHALRLRPNFAEAAFQLAGLYRSQERLEESVAAGRIAVQARPDYVEAWVNLGCTLEDLGRTEEAVAACDAALRHDPHSAEAHFNRAMAWLRAGDLERGWDEYEWRHASRSGRPVRTSNAGSAPMETSAAFAPTAMSQAPDGPSGPTWMSVAVLGEQGVGDEVMFASCLPDVLSRSRRCLATCDPRLRPLFARSFPEIEFHPRHGEPRDLTDSSILPRFEDGAQSAVAIPFGSLPRLLRRNVAAFPAHSGYLKPHPGLVAEWRRRFARLGAGPVVGVSWRGGRDPIVRRRRSIPPAEWSPLLCILGARFVNLQYGATPEELAAFAAAGIGPLHHWDDSDPQADLDGFAAQVAALDLVISADNATVHIAGALGKPVWTLLPAACDWRWGLTGDRTPWYPSMTLFRRTPCESWRDVVQRVAAAIAE